ncbi:hypothetical protein LEMLEM_LOCUS12195 [Lemmus lemmus]
MPNLSRSRRTRIT